jgi:hypothetical protein
LGPHGFGSFTLGFLDLDFLLRLLRLRLGELALLKLLDNPPKHFGSKPKYKSLQLDTSLKVFCEPPLSG